ncbi:hypothetical protein B0T24DRAFT_599960 [Lasiosphaeria ovina]|uniref:Uncharacterized protein n=1 Tax=Lasiosphaeria ovina TaxID=92902 RepID=A0AAE0JSR0_9PEZI|nr:hypothetical protein B0T24DRAFT_599960 [Lasiosphaeria ovina]
MADNTIQPSHQTPTMAESSQSLVSDLNPASTEDAGLAVEPTQNSPDSESFSAVPGISPQHEGPGATSPGIRSEEDDFAAVPEINSPQGESPPLSDTPKGNEYTASQHMIRSGDHYFGHHDNTTDRDESENIPNIGNMNISGEVCQLCGSDQHPSDGCFLYDPKVDLDVANLPSDNGWSVGNDQSGNNNAWGDEDGGSENISDEVCQLCGSDQHPSDGCFLNDPEVDLDVANLLSHLPIEDLIEIIRTDVLMSARGPIAALTERVENLTSAGSRELYALLVEYSDARHDSDQDRFSDGCEVFVPSLENSVLPVVEVPDHADEPESTELGHTDEL